MNTLVPILALAAGFLVGYTGILPDIYFSIDWPEVLLFALMLQVGMGLGVRPDLMDIFKSLNIKTLLLPIFTILGTLLFSTLAIFIFSHGNPSDILAIGSGFGYYSLSSVLIAKMKSATVGVNIAGQIAAIALVANVIREVIAVSTCSFMSRRGKGMAAISVAGVSSMDMCLPMIIGSGNDRQLVSAAVVHGVVLEFSVPLLVAFFCGL